MQRDRREVLKGVGYVSGIAIGAKSVQEAGAEIVDMLNGECDNRTDTIALGPGDAVHYRQNGQDYYLEHVDDDLPVEATARYGPLNGQKQTMHIDSNEQVEIDAGTATIQDKYFPFDIHVNLGDTVTGGDVIEPRGFYGLNLDNLQATYDQPVCVIERGEASELRE